MYTALLAQKINKGGSGGEAELSGVPPLTFRSNGTPLIDYLISGNMIQSGTPTPDNPIMPQGTGERTGNLWNEEGFSARAITSTHEHTDTNTYGTTLSTTIGKETIITQSEYPTGTVGYQNGFFFIDVDFSKYEIGDKVTLSFDYICNEVHSIEGQISTTLYAGKNSNTIPVVLSSGKWSVSGRLTAVITIIADMNPYVEVRLCGNSITVKNIMLNSGSTALPYEPFGVKIPISSAGQTTPVYLGETQTTRKIKKVVYDGTESWDRSTSGNNTRVYTPQIPKCMSLSPAICTHFDYNVANVGYPRIGEFVINSAKAIIFGVDGNTFADVTDWKAYLAAQYAAGTPVTVWYVLESETTGIVNEPLMRIGDYADTLSMEQASVQIPTNRGNTVIDVLTELKPSEVYIKYHTR